MKPNLETYYSLVDGYNLNIGSNFSFIDESEPIEINFFKDFCPIEISLLMNYVENIINKMCQALTLKEKVWNEIESLKKSNDMNNSNIYKWKNIDLKRLLQGKYDYLKDIFILRYDLVPDINYYINNYHYPYTKDVYPFSLEEMYHMLLERCISITINNYYLKLNNK